MFGPCVVLALWDKPSELRMLSSFHLIFAFLWRKSNSNQQAPYRGLPDLFVDIFTHPACPPFFSSNSWGWLSTGTWLWVPISLQKNVSTVVVVSLVRSEWWKQCRESQRPRQLNLFLWLQWITRCPHWLHGCDAGCNRSVTWSVFVAVKDTFLFFIDSAWLIWDGLILVWNEVPFIEVMLQQGGA